jgi:hypothetical protein
VLKARQSANFGHQGNGPGALAPPQSRKRLDHRRPAPRFDLLLPCLCKALEACGMLMDRSDIFVKDDVLRWGGANPIGAYLSLFSSPNATFLPPFAVGQDVYGLAVLARLAPWIPDALDAVDDCIESGVNAGDTPGDAPPTTCPVPAAAASPAPPHSPTHGSPLPVRVRLRRSTGSAALWSCFHATPRPSGAPGPSLPHWCGAGGVFGCAAAIAAFFFNTRSTCQRAR